MRTPATDDLREVAEWLEDTDQPKPARDVIDRVRLYLHYQARTLEDRRAAYNVGCTLSYYRKVLKQS